MGVLRKAGFLCVVGVGSVFARGVALVGGAGRKGCAIISAGCARKNVTMARGTVTYQEDYSPSACMYHVCIYCVCITYVCVYVCMFYACMYACV